MSWFEKIMPSRIKTERRTRSVPEGLWIKCPACDAVLYRAELERNLYVCPKCSHHMRIGGRERLESFLDPGDDRGDRRRHLAGGSAQIPRQQALQGPAGPGSEGHGRARCADRAGGQAAGPADRRLRVRVPVPGRLDGLGGGRAIQRGRRSLHRASQAACVFHRQRRRAHAGGAVLADADGQDGGGAVARLRRRICPTSRS